MSKDPEFDKMRQKTLTDVYDVGVGEETTELLRQIPDVHPETLEYGIRLQRKFGIIAKQGHVAFRRRHFCKSERLG